MWKFISNIVMMLSFGTFLYIIARALPRIDESEIEDKKLVKSHWIFYFLEKIDIRTKAYLEKFLRKIGVVLLKLENKVQKKLSKFKKESAPKKSFPSSEDLNSPDEDL